MPAANALAAYPAPRRSSKAARRSAEGRTRRRRGARKCFFSCRFVVASLGFQGGPRFASAAPSGFPVRPFCRTPPFHMENPAIARILLKTTRINRNAAGTSDEKRENVLISRKPPPLAVFVCRGYNDMRQKNQTRRAGDAGDKAARTCRKADAALSAVHREAQARLYRQQWRSPKRGAVKAAVRRSTDCRYIHRRRKRCVGRCNRRPAVRAVLPTAVARRPSPPCTR